MLNADALKLVKDDFKTSKEALNDFFELVQRLELLYRLELPDIILDTLDEENPGFVPPDLHNAVNDTKASVWDVFFGTGVNLIVEPGLACPRNVALEIEVGAKWLARHTKFSVEYTKTLASIIKYGAGVGIVQLEELKRKKFATDLLVTGDGDVPIMLAENEPLTQRGFVEQSETYPFYKHLPIRRFFPDPSIDRKRWGIYQDKISYRDVLQKKEEGEWSFEKGEITKDQFKRTDYYKNYPDSSRGKLMEGTDDTNFPCEILERRGWVLDKESGKVKDMIITVINQTVVVKNEENILPWPSVEGFIISESSIDDDEEVYKIGKMEACEALFYDLMYKMNLRIVNLTKAMNKMYISSDSNIPDYITSESGKVIHTSAPVEQNFKELAMQDYTSKIYNEIADARSEIRETFGTKSYSMGFDPQRKETATAVVTLDRNTAKELKLMVGQIKVTGLAVAYRQMLDLWALVMPDEVQIPGTKEVVLTPEHFTYEYLVNIDTDSVLNRPVEIQQSLQLLEIYRGDPDVNQIDLKRQPFRLLGWDADKLVPDPQWKIQEVMREAQALAQGVMQQVLPQDDHALHIQIESQLLMDASISPAIRENVVIPHLREHEAYLRPEQKGSRVAPTLKAENEGQLIQSEAQRNRPQYIGGNYA